MNCNQSFLHFVQTQYFFKHPFLCNYLKGKFNQRTSCHFWSYLAFYIIFSVTQYSKSVNIIHEFMFIIHSDQFMIQGDLYFTCGRFICYTCSHNFWYPQSSFIIGRDTIIKGGIIIYKKRRGLIILCSNCCISFIIILII